MRILQFTDALRQWFDKKLTNQSSVTNDLRFKNHSYPVKVKETLTPRPHPDSYRATKIALNQINKLVIFDDPACRLAG